MCSYGNDVGWCGCVVANHYGSVDDWICFGKQSSKAEPKIGGRVMDIVSVFVKIYAFALGTLGFYFLWKEWRWLAEEEKRRIRKITDEYMKEREK